MANGPVPQAASTPVPSSGVLTTLDTIVHAAVNVENLAAGIIAVLLPGFAMYEPEIIAVLNAIASALDKASGATPTSPQSPPTP